MPNPTLLILGGGDAPEKLLTSVLDDQLAATAFNPIDIQIWVLEGTEQPPALADLATYIEEEYEGLDYQWLQNRDGSSLVAAFRNSLTELGDIRRARVLVLWDESTATRQAVQAALDAHIEVYDLSDALTRIGSLASEDNNDKEQQPVPRASKTKAAEPSNYTYDQLMDMDEETIIPICQSFSINHEEFPDWESVCTLIVERQGAADGEPEPEAEAGDEEGGGGYTKEQLEALELDTLKNICKLNEIEVEGQRPRIGKYVEAILDFQEANGIVPGEAPDASDDRDAGDEGAANVEEAQEPRYSAQNIAELFGSLEGDISVIGDAVMGDEGLLALNRAVAEGMDNALKLIYERLGNLETLLSTQSGTEASSNGAAAPAKKAATAKKAAQTVRKLARPSA